MAQRGEPFSSRGHVSEQRLTASKRIYKYERQTETAVAHRAGANGYRHFSRFGPREMTIPIGSCSMGDCCFCLPFIFIDAFGRGQSLLGHMASRRERFAALGHAPT